MIRKNLFRAVLVLSLAAGSAGAAPRAPKTVGLKNFREILSSLEESTGVSAKTPLVAATYRKVFSRLPVKGDVQELGSPTVLALVELSGAFCRTLVETESGLSPADRRTFLFVDFGRGPDQFSASAWSQIAIDLSYAFWQREPNADEMALYRGILAKFKDQGATSATVTRRVLQAACVQAGSSLAFLTNGI